MIAAVLALLGRLGVPERFVRLVAIAAAVAAAILALGVAKCSYDHRLLQQHDAAAALDMSERARAADATAADARLTDTATIKEDADAETRAIAPIAATDIAARRHARACSILRRQARERGDAAPADC